MKAASRCLAIPNGRRPLLWAACLTGLLVVCSLLPPMRFFAHSDHYLPLHSALEFLSMAVCAMVFALGWNLREARLNSQAAVLGAVFLYVFVLDFVHTFSYQGMPAFITPSGPEKAINFWLAGRLGAAAGMFAVALMPLRQWSSGRASFVYALALLAAGGSVWFGLVHAERLPRTFLPESGLTPFKLASEYVLTAVYASAAFFFFRRGNARNSDEDLWLGAAAWTLALAELFLTFYLDVTDLFNLSGHIYKAAAHWMIYRALFVAGVRAPYRALQDQEARLEQLVERRTEEVKTTLAQYRTLIELAPVAIAMLDKELNYLAASSKWIEEFGRGSRQLAGRNHYELWPETPDHWLAAHLAALAGRRVGHDGDPMQAADGSRRWLRWATYPWRDERGEIAGIILFVEDITARKADEQALRDQEERLRLAMAAGRSGIFEWEAHSGLSYWSDELLVLHGLEREAYGGRHEEWLECVLPEDREAAHRAVLEAWGSGRMDVDFRIRNRRSGEIRWLSRRAKVYFDEGGRPARMLGIDIDITDRKRAEERLQASEEQFRQLAEALPQMVWTSSPDGHCSCMGSQWAAYAGNDCADGKGSWEDFLHPDDRGAAVLAWEGALKRGDIFDTEYRLRRHDGDYRWFRARALPLRDDRGQIVKWFGTCTDIDDSRRVTEALRLTSERFQTALKSAPVLVFNQDRQFAYTWIYNPNLGEEWCPASSAGDGPLFSRPEDAELLAAINREVTACGRGQRREAVMELAGKVRHFSLTVEPQFDVRGRAVGITCAAVDLSAQKEIEMALARERELLSNVVDNIPVMLFQFDPELRLFKPNCCAEAVFGWSAETAADARSLFAGLFPDKDAFDAALAHLQECSGSWREFAPRTRQGELVPSDWAVVGLSDRRRIAIGIDLRQRKAVDEKLARHAERQSILLDLASGMLQTHGDKAALAGLVFERVKEHLRADVCFNFRLPEGARQMELVAAFGIPAELNDNLQTLEVGQAYCGRVAAAGSGFVADCGRISQGEDAVAARELGLRAYVGYPLCGLDGKVIGTFALASRERESFGGEEVDFIQTIAYFLSLAWERRRAEVEIQRLNADLEKRVELRTNELAVANRALLRSNLELQRFAYVAAHDLQTPLRSIAGFAQLFSRQIRDGIDEQGAEYLRLVVENTKRMQILIDDLLAYARLDAQAHSFEATDMGRLIDEVRGSLAGTLRETGAALNYGNLPTVFADRGQLAQLLSNLIENGIKYNRSEKIVIQIFALRRGEDWVFGVRDNGIGIEPRYHGQIFEAFKRLHAYQEYPGSGVGLAICQKIVERHGGRIWVESAAGDGSTFYFTLPVGGAGENPQAAGGAGVA